MSVAYSEDSFYQRSARCEILDRERMAIIEGLSRDLSSMDKEKKDKLARLIEISDDQSREIRNLYQEQAGRATLAQVLRVDLDKRLWDMPVAEVLLQHGEVTKVALPAQVAGRLLPGSIVDLTLDLREVVDIADSPSVWRVARISGVSHTNGKTVIEIGSDGSRECLFPAVNFPVGRAKVGMLLEYFGRYAYALREEEAEHGPVRQAQVLGVRGSKLEVWLQNDEQVDLEVEPEVVAEVEPGTILKLSRDHTRVIDVVGSPDLYSVGTITGLSSENGRILIEVGNGHGTAPKALIPGPSFPIDKAKPGRKVNSWGRVAYTLREQEANAFLESHRGPETFNVAPTEVFGQDQQELILFLTTIFDIHAHPSKYPQRKRDNEHRIVVVGPSAVGKSESIKAGITKGRSQSLDIEYFALAADMFRGPVVGQTTENISGTIDTVNQLAARGGKTVVLVVEEATTLLLDRSRSSQYLDSGTSLRATETLMAKIESAASGGLHEDVVLILVSNRPDLMDQAALSRFVVKEVKTFGPVEFEAIARLWSQKEPALYSTAWKDGFSEALRDVVLPAKIGTVDVGSSGTRDILVSHVLNGRIARWSHTEAARVVDQFIKVAGSADLSPCTRISPALLATIQVRQALRELMPYSIADARQKFAGTDICRVGKEGSLSDVRSLNFEAVELPESLDARPLLAELSAAAADANSAEA